MSLTGVSEEVDFLNCYRIKELYEYRWPKCSYEISKSKPILKNRVNSEVEEVIVKIAFDYPSFGLQRVDDELQKEGMLISAGGVRNVWLRLLFTSLS